MFETKLYTYGPEEAKQIALHVKKVDKGNYSLEYADMPKAISIMREFRERMGLGDYVEITLKKEVKLRKQSTFQKTYRNMVCPYTRVTFGKYRGINPLTNTPQWSAVELNEYKAFNLQDDNDAADWIILRLAPCVEGSATSDRYHDTPYWQFNDVRASNSNNVGKARDIVRISQMIDGMSGSEILSLARYFGFVANPGDERTLKVVDVHGFLINIALENPGEFLTKCKDVNRTMHELIYAATALGHIQYSYTEGYKALGNVIGMTMEEVTGYLRNDKNLFGHLKAEVVGTDVLAQKLETEKPDSNTRKEAVLSAMALSNVPSDEEAIV